MLLQQRYRLIKPMGKGGSFKTFLAVDESYVPSVPCIVQEIPYNEPKADIYLNQVQNLQRLGEYRQFPTLLAYFVENQFFYLVFEYIKGDNLASLLAKQGTYHEAQVWQVLKNLLPVIKLLHEAHIIHRDINPENIILRNYSQFKQPGNELADELILVDFASIKLVNGIEDVIDNNIIGSPEYAAPEQISGNTVFASDLYSLGVTCIYLLTQISPFELFDAYNNVWLWRDYLTNSVSDRLGEILDQLIHPDVKARFQSADAVMQRLGINIKIPAYKQQRATSHWQCVDNFTGDISAVSAVNTLAISPDGQTLVSGDNDKKVKFWDLQTRKLIGNIPGHNQAVKSLAFSPNGQILATASDDKTIKIWQLETLEPIITLKGHTKAIKSVAFSSEGWLASGSWDKTVKIWDGETGDEICTLTGHKLQVTAVAFNPQGDILASASCDRTIRLWQLKKSQNCPFTLLGTLTGHAWAVLTVAFSPNGQILATGSDDNTIKLWDVNTGQLINTLLGHSWSVVALAFTADDSLISASWDKTVKIWRVSTGEEIDTLASHADSVNTIAVSPVAQMIASGSRDKTIKLWQLVKQQ
ncbi:serine/threonine-protein kinase [Richelia sinica]|uniref:serine/threonine-protein kinase n=1 Tax=Richelia sinica TaxID=1357545 RepID=UPI0021110DC6|nr:serine/threonine-protein kinase [Richelia sinica]